MTRAILSLTLLLTACDGGAETDAPSYPPLLEGKPVAGAAEGSLWLPFGTPLSGFSSRCGCLGGTSRQDDRDSAYTTGFVESTGFHIRPTIKAVWLSNGDEHLVMTKVDVIYAFDGFTEALTQRLEALTGEELDGRVTFAGNHNHSSYGTFSGHEGLFLGSDRYNEENFQRMLDQVAAVAYEAYQTRADAKVGIGWQDGFDPDDRIYSDRRGVNNDLVVWPDAGPEQGRKDDMLQVIRIDAAADDHPIAVVMSWGMHPYAFGEQVPLATADATYSIEQEVAESFGQPVVAMYLQTSAGDASVRGKEDDNDYARMESLGLLARDTILALREATPTADTPIRLETVSRSIPMSLDQVRVSRNGAVNWYYPPFDPEREADDVVYDDQGKILSPLDEYNTDYGTAFCGSGDFDLPVGGMLTDAPEYTSCMNVSLLKGLIQGFFRMTPEEVSLPLDGMEAVYTTMSRLGGISVRNADGSAGTSDVLFGFFPGEVTSMYGEQFRRRAKDELGYDHAIPFGYAIDHEGYLLIPEDWLLGEYEADISFWGPLGAEYIMEQMLGYGQSLLGTTDLKEGHDPAAGPHVYPDYPLPTEQPDLTPTAGTRLTNATLPPYYWIPDRYGSDDGPFTVDLDIPAVLPRVQGTLQIGWIGGDPAVDDTRIVLERQAEDGSWAPVTTPGGRVVDEQHHDFIVGWTPDPLFPSEADQTHTYWATWQAVGHIGEDRVGLALGTYRLTVTGHRYTGGSASWPWATEAYSFSTEAFELVPAAITIEPAASGLQASIVGPAAGFRLLDLEGDSRGHNPLRGSLTVAWTINGSETVETVTATAPSGGRTTIPFPAGTSPDAAVITDAFGNTGTWTRTPPP